MKRTCPVTSQTPKNDSLRSPLFASTPKCPAILRATAASEKLPQHPVHANLKVIKEFISKNHLNKGASSFNSFVALLWNIRQMNVKIYIYRTEQLRKLFDGQRGERTTDG